MDVEIHQHSAFQIVIARDAPFRSKIGGQQYDGLAGFVIRPQVPHVCTGVQGRSIILNIEPDSPGGLMLARVFEPGQDRLPFYKPEDVLGLFPSAASGPGNDVVAALTACLSTAERKKTVDTRIGEVIRNIRENNGTPFSQREAAAKAFLSISRFSALFKAETGSSLSKFVLWSRLRHAIVLMLADPGRSITTVAHETGFYDSAHFTRAMYQLIGVKPVVLRKNSNLIQFLA